MKVNDKYIGCNFTGYAYIGGVASSYSGVFKDEEVLISSSLDYIPCMMGNVNEAYEMLKDNIIKNNATEFIDICACIYDTVDNYFGGIKNIDKRMSYYKDLDEIENEDDITKVASLKGTGAAMCVERAMLSQNLLLSLGINSIYKASGIKKNGHNEIHAYNLVSNDDKYYIFDASMPTERNEKISPLITEIPQEVFNQISSPSHKEGYSVKITHYNPLRNIDVEVIYDAYRDNIYIADDTNNKTK